MVLTLKLVRRNKAFINVLEVRDDLHPSITVRQDFGERGRGKDGGWRSGKDAGRLGSWKLGVGW